MHLRRSLHVLMLSAFGCAAAGALAHDIPVPVIPPNAFWPAVHPDVHVIIDAYETCAAGHALPAARQDCVWQTVGPLIDALDPDANCPHPSSHGCDYVVMDLIFAFVRLERWSSAQDREEHARRLVSRLEGFRNVPGFLLVGQASIFEACTTQGDHVCAAQAKDRFVQLVLENQFDPARLPAGHELFEELGATRRLAESYLGLALEVDA